MIESKKRWRLEHPDDQIVQHLQLELKIPKVSAKLLASRGFVDVNKTKAFLHMDETSIHDPFLLYGMDRAVARIKSAIENEELILVYGDYDADGVTSTTVIVTALQQLNAQVTYVIPNRFVDGYGPSERLFKEAFEDGVNLIITVDNGISGINEIQLAKDLGMDVIVTDHHEAGEILPPADVIIHPRHPQGTYPFGELAGVGVAFKVAHALLGEIPKNLLELVAIGTIADLVPLQDENRYFVQQGIKQLRMSKRPAISALCQVSGTEQDQINEETLGFLFGPRINALGRLADAGPAVEMFLSTDSVEATSLAKVLDTHNKERQGIVSKMTEEAITMVESEESGKDPLVIVLAKEGWNPGVVGIVASRLVEKYYRPTIVLGLDSEKGIAKGSGRSIEGFHLYNELAKNRDILPHFGGHPMAAGMTLPIEQVDDLRNRLQTQAIEALTEEDLQPIQQIDISIKIDEIDLKSIESLQKLGPFGMGFPKPMYCIEEVSITSMRKIGANQNHVKMELSDGPDSIDAVGFSQGHLVDELTPGVEVSFIGDIQINEWNGRKKPQFMIEDAKSDKWQLYDIRGIRQVNRWNQKIHQEQTLYLAFEKSTVQHFESLLNINIVLISETQDLPFPKNHIVLLDIPKNEKMLETVLTHIQPKRIYAHFYAPESTYFEGMPSRDHFKWYYGFLAKRSSFDLQENVKELAKHKGWSTSILFFMTEVFFDLGFVKINSGRIDMQEIGEKRDLAESLVYQSRERQMQLEQKLLYAPYMELRQWFDERLAEQTVPEEEQLWI
ncbi:single-stranded-DNA-specific exonuclease RecJ [Paenisporosarcina sp. TG20]|uniref:single-stranded-DNA-specific exonuclease RecJ n=1 Tax=Paenisporosarcina sp. TG20 TaxID=1211706 RepID=UPI0002E85095|nr:single-stranded-DNA-specific exonuclease RecJ [Paenisporosarcina sp. TG20]